MRSLTAGVRRGEDGSLGARLQLTALFISDGEPLQEALHHVFGVVREVKGHDGARRLRPVLLPHRKTSTGAFPAATVHKNFILFTLNL